MKLNLAIRTAVIVLWHCSSNSFAALPCTSILECQNIIRAAKNVIASNTTDPHVCYLNGTVLERDNSNPKLGLAYRDTRNVVWGNILMGDRGPKQITSDQAAAYCQSINAELPKKSDFDNLLSSLSITPPGRHGYSICGVLDQSSTEILPNWSSEVWTATSFEGELINFRLFNGIDLHAQGPALPASDPLNFTGVRCIYRE